MISIATGHRPRILATMPSWRGLLVAILVASGCAYVIPVQRSIGLFTETHANASVVSASSLLPPVSLLANATGPSSVSLNWSPSPSAIADAYEVWRISDGEPDYSLIATQVGHNTTSYNDTGLLAVTGYTYYIVAIDGGWSSAPSPAAIAITTS